MRREDIEKAAKADVFIDWGETECRFVVEFAIQQVNTALEEARKDIVVHCCDQCLAPADEAIRALKIK